VEVLKRFAWREQRDSKSHPLAQKHMADEDRGFYADRLLDLRAKHTLVM
jgi:hypothetical protein